MVQVNDRPMSPLYDYDDYDDSDDDPYGDATDVLRIGPGRARVSFDLRCPVCGDRARTPEMVSKAIDDDGKPCPYDDPGARWMEWHECPCCGEWYSLLNGI
jgi:hypothetical protein